MTRQIATDPAAAASPPESPVSNDQALVSVQGLVKYFPIMGGLLRRKVGDIKAVDGVSFDISRGEVFGLVGESGCGKTTLGRAVLYLQRPTAGDVLFDGQNLSTLKASKLRHMRSRMQLIF
ncbi:MAG: ATP-binding cassette domain-containing protein, partial [Isosphaeraceae bacterium]